MMFNPFRHSTGCKKLGINFYLNRFLGFSLTRQSFPMLMHFGFFLLPIDELKMTRAITIALTAYENQNSYKFEGLIQVCGFLEIFFV